jgi:hypothetical protein
LNKLIGIVSPIFLAIGLITLAITLTFFSFIVTAQAETKGISSAKEIDDSFFSTTTKDNNILKQSTAIIVNQEKNTLNENLSSYEGIGIKLEYSYPWTIETKSDKPTCYNIDLCFIYLGINQTDMPQLWIIQDSFESQTIKEYCKCNTLQDYASHFYKYMISHFDNFSFINENYSTFSTGDIPTIQLEYEFSPANKTIHTFTVFTKDNDDDSFYQFIYYADPESFSNYLSHFKKIIDTVEFDSEKES